MRTLMACAIGHKEYYIHMTYPRYSSRYRDLWDTKKIVFLRGKQVLTHSVSLKSWHRSRRWIKETEQTSPFAYTLSVWSRDEDRKTKRWMGNEHKEKVGQVDEKKGSTLYMLYRRASRRRWSPCVVYRWGVNDATCAGIVERLDRKLRKLLDDQVDRITEGLVFFLTSS